MRWRVVDRPGYAGELRDSTWATWDRQYGPGNWRLSWQLRDHLGTWEDACRAVEASYVLFLEQRSGLLAKLVEAARDVYETAESNVDSGRDYGIQEAPVTHVTDVAIRRAIECLNRFFEGRGLVQIGPGSIHWIGRQLSPTQVPFFRPEQILQPMIPGWWSEDGQRDSVMNWYHSNKVLEVWS